MQYHETTDLGEQERNIMGTFEDRLNQGSEGDRADYESRSSNADPITQANQKTNNVMHRLAAQRAADRVWGKPAPTDETHTDRY